MNRMEHAAKNFIWSTVSNLSTSILSFISRTIFIHMLGDVYLGINGLFTNILSLLSLAELGVGSAITFSLYKPLAEKDKLKVNQIMNFYRNAYRIIALIVAVMGCCLIPFLNIIAKGKGNVDNLLLIYCIFLFNTVISYLFSYKTTLVEADQKSYLLININIVFNIITNVFQVIVLLAFKNYIIYLIVQSILIFSKNVYINMYINKKYKFIREKTDAKLPDSEKTLIITKIKAMMYHKVGEVCIYQTDNIITSSFINVRTVGLVSNFTMIIDMINKFIIAFFNSATAGFGNLIATEKKEKQIQVFERYNFFAFYFYGVSAICLFFLLSPFIQLWIGKNQLIGGVTVALLCINYYLTGMRVPLGNVKVAAGAFEQDKWIPIIQSVVNIVVSVIGAIKLGLPGIYLGTFISSLLPNVYRPIVVYKYVLNCGYKRYFVEYFKRILFIIFTCIGIRLLFVGFEQIIMNLWILFIVKLIFVLLIPNVLILMLYGRSDEYKYLWSIIFKLLRKKRS